MTFKSINGSKGEFTLANSYTTNLGYDTLIIYQKDVKLSKYNGDNLDIDTTPVVVNAAN